MSSSQCEEGIKSVLFLTGTRADFGKIKPLIQKVDDHPGFDARVFVTGMHLLRRYGYTFEEIQKVGFKNIFTFDNHVEVGSTNMDLILANTVQGLGEHVRVHRPEMIVVHGDRVEALAGAIVGSLNNILVSHIEGGELSGTIDELIRHSVSKMSHLHFVANEVAAKRLHQMGELKDSVFSIGSPEVDIMLGDSLPSLEEAKTRYGIHFDSYCIFLYHPVTTEINAIESRIGEVVDGLMASERRFVAIFPNNDSGSDIILERIQQLQSNEERFRVLPSLRFEHFLTLLKHADAIVGNSSSGVREAPVFGTPTVNLGSRQNKRFLYESILNVEESSESIVEALNNLPSTHQPVMQFGRGNSAAQFISILERKKTWETSSQKLFQDLGSL